MRVRARARESVPGITYCFSLLGEHTGTIGSINASRNRERHVMRAGDAAADARA